MGSSPNHPQFTLKFNFHKGENTLKTRINGCDLGNLEKSIAGLETRKYAPRINADLFNL